MIEMSMVTLDSDHRYWQKKGDTREEVPGVSRILEASGEKSGYRVRNSEFYMTRGSFAHKAAALDDMGMLREDTVDPRVMPYLVAWRDFKQLTGVQILASELLVFNQRLGYAGTLDRIVKGNEFNRGRAMLLDLKSGTKCPWHPLQLAAYWVCMADKKMDAGCLYLKKTGKWSLDVLSPMELNEAVGRWQQIVEQFKEVNLWRG